MNNSDILCQFRALWRRLFHPEPPARLDGIVIQLRTLMACGSSKRWTFEEWQRQLGIRADENRERNESWKRGERLY